MLDGDIGNTKTPLRDHRRKITLLRGTLIVAVGALMLMPDSPRSGAAAVVLLIAFAISDALVYFTPLRLIGSRWFEMLVGAADVVLVALGIHLAGVAGGVLPITCLLMVLVVALGNYRWHTVAGASAVGALHAWLVVGGGPALATAWQLGLQILFLCSVALYYGYLAEPIHDRRRKREAEKLERQELAVLLDILDAITSSLDLRQVTRTIVCKLASVVPALRCSILLIDPGRSRCYVLASHDDPDVDMLEIDLKKYPEVRQAIETRNPVLIRDVASDPTMASVRALLDQLDFRSIMVVPLTFADEVLGTLCLKTARANEAFSRLEIDFCTAVARASANALKNAVLHRQVSEEAGRHRRTGEELTSILDHTTELILTTDNDGLITRFNRGGEQLLGFGRDEIVGERCESLFVEFTEEQLVERIRSSGVVSNHDCRLRTRDGGERSMLFNMTALRNELGDVTGTVWIGRDVTELKTTQMQLLQAEKLSTIGEVMSGVAHELNNPLSGVLGFSQLLLARHADGPLGRELEKINESAQRCHKIVKNLLSFARGHRPERKYLGVNGILEKTLELKRYQLHVNNVQIRTELDPELPCTLLDYHQMQQVFLNLINNAHQAIAAVRERPGQLTVRSRLVDGRIRVEVRDNGEGMDRPTLERVFNPFFTTKEQGQGTGLGLSVSYGIVNEHGGRIWAESKPGAGATFIVELPVRADPGVGANEPAAVQSAPLPSSPAGKRILVVDDEPVLLDLMVDILGSAGYRVDTAANGDEACKKVRGGDHDLIISDVRMPRMNGMELYGKVMECRPELQGRVIFVTGDLIDREVVEFLGQIQARTLPKPLDIPEILKTVEKLLATESPVPV